MTELDDRQKIHALVDSVLNQKSSGRTWGVITLEITFQDGQPTLGRLTDETTFKFDRKNCSSAERGPDVVPQPSQRTVG